MLGDIYYTLGLIPLFMTLALLIKLKEYNRVKEWYIKFEEVTKIKPIKSDFRTDSEYTTFIGASGIMAIDFMWMMLGILTQSWYVFLFVLIISLVLNKIKTGIKITILSNFLTFIIIANKFLVYLYLIINHFHLHIDTWEVVKSYL